MFGDVINKSFSSSFWAREREMPQHLSLSLFWLYSGYCGAIKLQNIGLEGVSREVGAFSEGIGVGTMPAGWRRYSAGSRARAVQVRCLSAAEELEPL